MSDRSDDRGFGRLPEPEVTVRTLTATEEFRAHEELLQQVWGVSAPLVTIELLAAIAHSGGYVAAAFDANATMVGASVGFLADHRGQRALHSHVTGVNASMRHAGVGRAIKLHQRSWARTQQLGAIIWTFDPLVRRNAWFNIAVLGARVDSYLPSFYGTMTDAINAGDESDRVLIEWNVEHAVPASSRESASLTAPDLAGDLTLVPTPVDIVELRRQDPAAARDWRTQVRRTLGGAIAEGRPVLGFTRAGEYVIGSAP